MAGNRWTDRQHRDTNHGSTRTGPKHKDHRGQDLPEEIRPKVQLCKDAPETVQHIVAGCKMQAGSAYMERHNQVAGIVYRNIWTQYGLEGPKQG